jgi:hypothetical protein
MGFKPVSGGVAGPPEVAGLLKEGDYFVGVSYLVTFNPSNLF